MDPEVREVGSPLAQGPDVTMRPRTLPLSARAPRQPPLLTRSGQSGAERSSHTGISPLGAQL